MLPLTGGAPVHVLLLPVFVPCPSLLWFFVSSALELISWQKVEWGKGCSQATEAKEGSEVHGLVPISVRVLLRLP